MLDFIKDLLWSHLFAAVEAVFRITPNAAQIAACQPHKYAWRSSIGGLALERFVDLGDLHFLIGTSAHRVIWSSKTAPERNHNRPHSLYFAVVESVSNTVTSFTCTRPLVTCRSRPFASS